MLYSMVVVGGIHVNEVMPLRILFLVVKAKGQIASSDIQPIP